MNKPLRSQRGSSLIEVLVAILLLSFGMLSLGGMLSFAVQLPKLSAYRATAAMLAANHVERIRANPDGFAQSNNAGGFYAAALNETTNWSFTAIPIAVGNCGFSTTECTLQTLASTDINEFRNIVRRELPAGDIMTTCSNTPCVKSSFGELWVIWQEPTGMAVLNSASDSCPAAATALYTSPTPRCLYIRFKVE